LQYGNLTITVTWSGHQVTTYILYESIEIVYSAIKRPLKKASLGADLSMEIAEDKPDVDQIYSLVDKPYYVDRVKYKVE
jgi:hypothetical protein